MTEMLCPPGVARGLERAAELGETGLQVAAYVDGELVVDAWMGAADAETGAPVVADTLFPIFSVTKAYPVTAIHILAERGLLDYDAPIARYWPAFGQNGKDGVRVRDMLTHRSGVPQMPVPSGEDEMSDWDHMTAAIAALPPKTPPGEKSTYQAINLGWVLGEVVRGADPEHRHFSQFLREEILEPLHIDDTYIGLPEEEEPRLCRLSTGYSAPTPPEAAPGRFDAYGAMTTPEHFSSRKIRASCLPAGNGISTARSNVRLWAMLANAGRLDDVRLLSPHRVWGCLRMRPNPREFDDVLGLHPVIGYGGYWRGEDAVGDDHPDLLCQPGSGGSIAWAELETRLAVSICHNRMFTYGEAKALGEHPHWALIDAIREVARERMQEPELLLG